MGVKGTHALLRKNKRIEQARDWTALNLPANHAIYLDFFGSFFSDLLRVYSSNSPRPEKQLVGLLKHVFGPANTQIIVVLDGGHSAEKADAHKLRSQKTNNQLQLLDSLVDDLVVTKKIRKSKWVRIDKLRRSTYRIAENQLKQLAAEMRDSGFQVVQAAGEADVYIAAAGGQKIAVSGDSDLFFANKVEHVLVPVKERGSTRFKLVSRSKILETLNLVDAAWVALGVVSGNDYNQNITGYGIRSNLKIMQSLYADDKKPVTIADFVQRYCKFLNQDASVSFQRALKIFCEMKETLLPLAPSSVKIRDRILNKLDTKLALYGEWKSQPRKSAKANNLEHLKLGRKKNGYNQFKPLYANDTPTRYSFQTARPTKPGRQVPAEPKSRSPIETEPNPQKVKSSAVKKPKAQSKQKKPPKKGNYQASSKKARDLDVPEDREIKKRKSDKETTLMRSLKGRYATISWPVGSVKANLKRGVPDKEAAAVIQRTIEYAVQDLNLLKRAAQLLTNAFVEHVIASYGDRDKSFLNDILHSKTGGQGGNVYWQGVLLLLKNGQSVN